MSSFAAAMAVVALFSPTSEAELDLRWDAPLSCPSAGQVREWVGEQLADRELAGSVTVQATARASKAGWSVVLELRTSRGSRQRVIPPQPTCTSAARASAFIIAVALDPTLGLALGLESEPEPEPRLVVPPSSFREPLPEYDRPPAGAPVSNGPEPPVVDGATIPASPPQPRSTPAVRGAIHGSVGVLWNVLPRLALMAGGGASVLWRKAFLRSYALAVVPQRLLVDARPTQFRAWSVGLLAGPRWEVPRAKIDLELGLGVEAGRISVQPVGLERVRKPWVAWVLEPAIAVAPVPWLALGLRTRAAGPFFRPRYPVTPQTYYQPGVVGLAAVFFLEGRFP